MIIFGFVSDIHWAGDNTCDNGQEKNISLASHPLEETKFGILLKLSSSKLSGYCFY